MTCLPGRTGSALWNCQSATRHTHVPIIGSASLPHVPVGRRLGSQLKRATGAAFGQCGFWMADGHMQRPKGQARPSANVAAAASGYVYFGYSGFRFESLPQAALSILAPRYMQGDAGYEPRRRSPGAGRVLMAPSPRQQAGDRQPSQRRQLTGLNYAMEQTEMQCLLAKAEILTEANNLLDVFENCSVILDEFEQDENYPSNPNTSLADRFHSVVASGESHPNEDLEITDLDGQGEA